MSYMQVTMAIMAFLYAKRVEPNAQEKLDKISPKIPSTLNHENQMKLLLWRYFTGIKLRRRFRKRHQDILLMEADCHSEFNLIGKRYMSAIS
jgi:transposase